MSYQQSQLVDKYIAQFHGETCERLVLMRALIQLTFPKTVEDISYGIPTYRLESGGRSLISFAASKNHIGLYGIIEYGHEAAINSETKKYRTGKGTLQFKSQEIFPEGGIRRILAHYADHIQSKN